MMGVGYVGGETNKQPFERLVGRIFLRGKGYNKPVGCK